MYLTFLWLADEASVLFFFFCAKFSVQQYDIHTAGLTAWKRHGDGEYADLPNPEGTLVAFHLMKNIVREQLHHLDVEFLLCYMFGKM